MKIAITGKGGVGKTTFAATLARVYAEEGRTVLAADVDPDANLGLALAMEEQGITLEDYWALAEEHARHTVLRAKYQEWFYAAQLPEQEIDPEKNPQQAYEAYEEHCQQLLSAASSHITRR